MCYIAGRYVHSSLHMRCALNQASRLLAHFAISTGQKRARQPVAGGRTGERNRSRLWDQTEEKVIFAAGCKVAGCKHMRQLIPKLQNREARIPKLPACNTSDGEAA